MRKSFYFTLILVLCVGGYFGFLNKDKTSRQTQTVSVSTTSSEEDKLSSSKLQSSLTSSNKENEIVFHRGNNAELGSVDPLYTSGKWENVVVEDLFEGLVVIGENGQASPGIAERWEVSEDGKTYTFYMRKTAKWSNGDLITSKDVLYSLRRAIDPKNGGNYIDKFYAIVNAEDIYNGKIQDKTALGVEALDDYTIVIHLNKPTPYFEEYMTQSVYYIVPEKIVEQYGKDWTDPKNIITNGAYVLKDWRLHEYIEAEKNPYYWDAENVQIDRVFFYPIEDIETAFRHFRSGELDFQEDAPAHKIAWIRENMPNNFYLPDQWVNYYYVFNLELDVFKDIRVRKALSLAANREVIATNVLKFGFTPQYSFCPEGLVNYTPQNVDYMNLSQQERDEEAKRLLAEAGYGPENPLKLELAYNVSENHEKIAVTLAQMWKSKLGVQVELVNAEAKVHFDNLKKHNFQMARAAFGISSGDAYELLEVFHIGNHFNYAQYVNEEVDRLLLEAKHMPDLVERKSYLEKAESLIMADHAVIPLFTYAGRLLVGDRVEGFKTNYPGYYLTKFFRLKANVTE